MGDIRGEIKHPDIYSSIRTESRFFAKYLRDKILDERTKISRDLEQENLLKSLVAILLDYKDNKITIPGVNLPIADFINTLQEHLNRLEGVTSKIENVEQCAQSLEQLVKWLDNGIDTFEKIKQRKDFGEAEIENFSDLQEQEGLNNRLKNHTAKIKVLRSDAIKEEINPDDLEKAYSTLAKDPDVSFYETYNEKQIKEKVEDLKKST